MARHFDLAGELTSEFGRALRYALGDSQVSPGRKTDLWVAASRVRAPFDDDLLLHGEYGPLGPDGALAARYFWQVGHVTKTYGGRYDSHTMNFYPFHLRVEPDIPKAIEPRLGHCSIPRCSSIAGKPGWHERQHRSLGRDDLACCASHSSRLEQGR